MIPIDRISGRLGNQMFLIAFLYAYARDNDLPLVDNSLGHYYQDPVYFDKYRNKIRSLFSSGIPDKTDKVAIHVRRGDYVNNPFYVDLSKTDYYEKAIAHFPNEKFIVFSDDIKFCEEYFIGDEFEFCYLPEIESMNLMASCKGIIMANSSFSWWSAYLSNAKVVYPRLWYTDGKERTKFISKWIKV